MQLVRKVKVILQVVGECNQCLASSCGEKRDDLTFNNIYNTYIPFSSWDIVYLGYSLE